jgi:hypothetical protein
VWRNTIKKRREKARRVTPAMLVGAQSRPLRVRDVLARRLFVEKVDLPRRWRDYYCRRVQTRALAVNRTHNLAYAF